MIEVVKEGKTPKNIRQIGQVSGNQKVYLEDYVITYLKQPPSPDESMRVVILYGKKEVMEDELCWFVNGAIGAEKDFFMEKTVIDQESWQRVNELAGRFFPEAAVLGWAIVGNDSTKEIEEQILRTQRQFFRSDQKLYFEYHTDDKEEYLYLFEKGKMHQQSGYYIYYDRNECMQNYMVSLRAAERHPEEFEADRAAKQFRERTSEKRQEIHRHRSATLATCLSLALMLVIMAVGKIMTARNKKAAPAVQEPAAPASAAPAPAAPVAPPAPGSAGQIKLYDTPDRDAAMIMAIVAHKMGKPINELRFISIKEVK